ncbi:hypothetical protein IMSHALPRED_006762 [Imshaugia aleurites]|uniref:Uncharacterized protein n=1 Tax=Imshaugia aleurites TaxID=172621 RepID=A0A8H3FMT5_9LECA|nr:hypothetical protein IMSHALPRED_006762 [Imshaugia aleurites]
MGSPWAQFISDPYDSAAESPSSPADTAGRPAFPFMRLPVEIRLQVYKIYLVDRYSPSPAQIHEGILDQSHWAILEKDHWAQSSAEILRVSKAVNAEVLDLLRHASTFSLRVCWQDATFDRLAMSCFRVRGKRLDYDRIAHLKVEIYPPHHHRPTDMVQIWRHVHKLCSDLQEASRIQHLSIYFMENQYAKWSPDNKPWDSMALSYDSDRSPSDVLHILDLFRLLINVTKAQIYLPISLMEDASLQESRQDAEEVMMKIKLTDDEHKKRVVRALEEAILDNEGELEYSTGRNSQLKLELLGIKYWKSRGSSQLFDEVWPHREEFDGDYSVYSEYIDLSAVRLRVSAACGSPARLQFSVSRSPNWARRS